MRLACATVWEPASNKTYMHQEGKKKKALSCPIHFPTKMQLGTQESKHIVNSWWPKCHSFEWHALVMRDVRVLETDRDCRANLGIYYCAISQTSFPDTPQEGSSPFPGTLSPNLISTTQIGREHILHALTLLPSQSLASIQYSSTLTFLGSMTHHTYLNLLLISDCYFKYFVPFFQKHLRIFYKIQKSCPWDWKDS